jgi:hypothetical protein
LGLFNAILGNVSRVDEAKLEAEFAPVLAPEESVAGAWRLVRDMLVFTNRRIILLDRQGMTGRKVQYLSIPFREVARFSVETAGTFDLEAELKVWPRGAAEPIAFQFPRGSQILDAHRILATRVLA